MGCLLFVTVVFLLRLLGHHGLTKWPDQSAELRPGEGFPTSPHRQHPTGWSVPQPSTGDPVEPGDHRGESGDLDPTRRVVLIHGPIEVNDLIVLMLVIYQNTITWTFKVTSLGTK